MMFSGFLSDPLIQKIIGALEPVEVECDTHEIKREGQRPAAILVPLVWRADTWQVILTRRPLHMPSHPGQIAFPGGRTELGECPFEGALRETHEEIGVAPRDIHLLGRLPSFDAVSEYRVTPFVGLINPAASLTPDPSEVDEIFEVPFSFFMDPKNHVRHERNFDGRMHVLYDMPWPSAQDNQYNIWGMTAMMMYRLYQRGFASSL